MSRRTIFITGATGFIGSHLLNSFLHEHVVGLCAHSAIPKEPQVQFEQIVLPHPQFEKLIADLKPQEIIHCAGSASVGFSLENPYADFQSGPPVVFQLFEAVRKYSPKTRITLLSSAAVYGNNANLPLCESVGAAPISPYGWHKLQCEQIAQEYATLYGVSSYSLRIFSCYGNGLRKQLLWDIAQKIQKKELFLFGTGQETRDFIHISDLVRGITTLLQLPAKPQNVILNMASGTQTSVENIAKMLCNAFNYSTKAVFDGVVRHGDPLYWQADITALQRLGFTPQFSMEQGINDYVQWFLAQKK